MNKILFALVILSVIMLAGCSKPAAVVCNAPYIQKGTECCLDRNSNNICDSDEGVVPATETTMKATTTQAPATTTTIKETGELNPAFFDIPDVLFLGIPFYTGIGDVPREFAATIFLPPITNSDYNKINGTMIIKATCHPGNLAGENTNYIYCTGNKDFDDKVGSNGVVLRVSGRYAVTLVLERTANTLEITNYHGGIWESNVLEKSFKVAS
jgi:hypothetical protein